MLGETHVRIKDFENLKNKKTKVQREVPLVLGCARKSPLLFLSQMNLDSLHGCLVEIAFSLLHF